MHLILLRVTAVNGTYSGVHMIAAILMIAGLATAIDSHGRDPATKESTPGIARQYQVIVWLKGPVGVALAYELMWRWPFESAVENIEWAAILLFTWYGVAETVRQERLIGEVQLAPRTAVSRAARGRAG